jgi:CubicO group peptidase (beta-lactamase class C family)
VKKLHLKALFAVSVVSLAVPLAAQVPAAQEVSGKTSSGVSYTQPKDWTLTTKAGVSIFTAPENNLQIAVIDVGKATGAEAAAAKAWSLYKPKAGRKVRVITAGAPGEGWDERVSISYDTSPSEKMVVAVLAMRKANAWTVMIADGAESTFSKRSAAASVIQQSLRPAGYSRESFAGKRAHRLTPDRVEALRSFVADSARTLEVPGVGLALIDQGKVVWQGGLGVRKLGSDEPVTEHTKFMIASNTKGMATLLLSVLADEGKLRWDQPVTELYPEFRLGSDETTKATQVRHLVCACTGLPRKDFAFILSDAGAPASDTFRQLSETQPTSKFGELFQYNNLMASAAGYLGGALAYPGMEVGAAFDEAMKSRVFDPLGMRNTTFDLRQGESGNWARPHGLDPEGRMVSIPNDFNHLIVPHRPAGGAWSTPADMARYAQLELAKGLTHEGKRLVSEANILERRRRGVPVGEDSWYGMGLFERIAWGVPVVTHGGTLQGYHSTFYVLPEAGIGAVILTNADTGAAMLAPFLRRVMEVLYDGKPEAVQEIAAAKERIKAQSKARRERLTIPGDPAVLANLAPKYRSPLGSTISVEDRDGAKWIKAGFIQGPVATRKNPDGSVSLVSIGGGSIGVDALIGNLNGVRTLTIRDSQHEYVYSESR